MNRKLLNTLLGICVLLFVQQAKAQPGLEVISGPQIVFEKEMHDFGDIEEGTKPTVTLYYTNTGNAPLILESAKGSCSCTVPEWSAEPVLPGQKGEITVSYDATSVGPVSKSVTVKSNAVNEPMKIIRIKGTVVAAAEEEQDVETPAE